MNSELQALVLDLYERSGSSKSLEQVLAECSESGYQFRVLAGQFNSAAALAQAAHMAGFFAGFAARRAEK